MAAIKTDERNCADCRECRRYPRNGTGVCKIGCRRGHWQDRYGNERWLKWEYRQSSKGKYTYNAYFGKGWTRYHLKIATQAKTCKDYDSMID